MIFAQQPVALAFAVGPRRIEEIAAQVNGQLHRRQRFLVVRTAPSAHPPQSVGNLANVETSTAKLAVFHKWVLWEI